MRTTVKLTSAQKKLVRSVPGLAERAARDATKRFGALQPLDVMERSAHYGIALAAQSFDPDTGPSFEQWAYLKAMATIMDDARSERRQADRIAAGRHAAMELLRFEHRASREEDAYATEQQDRSELNAYKAGVVAAFMRGLAGTPMAAGGEDEMISRIDATRAAEALHRVYEGFRPEQLELLACEGETDLKELAPKWRKSWWTLARARQKLLKVVGARLMGQNIEEMPAWDEEIWGALAGTQDAPSGASRSVVL
jgi:hypothetical protein